MYFNTPQQQMQRKKDNYNSDADHEPPSGSLMMKNTESSNGRIEKSANNDYIDKSKDFYQDKSSTKYKKFRELSQKLEEIDCKY
jgi:hypothetical protein